MTEDEAGEQPRERPFWELQSLAEAEVVNNALRDRFGLTYRILSESLEYGDPMDIVYPDNPGEYSDVVREILVLMASRGGNIGAFSDVELHELMDRGIARCFGEDPDSERLEKTISKIWDLCKKSAP